MHLFQRGFRFCQSRGNWFQDHYFQNFTFQTMNPNQNMEQILKAFQNEGIEVSYCKQMEGNQKYRQISISIPSQNEHLIENMSHSFKEMGIKMKKQDPIEVQWFPRAIEQLDLIQPQILDFGEKAFQESEAGQDQEYRKRLNFINNKAKYNRMGQLIEHLEYNQKEEQVWRYLINKIENYHKEYMCDEYNENMQKLKQQLNIAERIPQLQNVSDYLQCKTGFRIKPTHGIISQRAFLNALAFKVFHATQYIRHHSNPDYAYSPDLFHEIVGHVPMFAHPIIAKVSELIGLASLGVSEERVSQLGALYLFTIEFGLIMKKGLPYSYGAGTASCIDEMVHTRSKSAQFKRLQPQIDCINAYPIMDLQPQYYYTSSLMEALDLLEKFCQNSERPFNARLSKDGKSILYDRNIKFKMNK